MTHNRPNLNVFINNKHISKCREAQNESALQYLENKNDYFRWSHGHKVRIKK